MEDTAADQLTVHITGDISPDSIGAGELGTLLQNLEQALAPSFEQEGRGSGTSPIISLQALSSGTLNLSFAMPSSFNPALAALVASLDAGDISPLPEKARRAVIFLGKWCMTKARTIEWLKGNEKVATITPTLDLSFETAPRLKGTTALRGSIRKVGGEKPGFSLRTPGGDIIHCSCDEELARLCGQYLYRNVRVEGREIHNVQTGEIESFEAEAAFLAERNMGEGFEAIREQFGSVFDAIDVDHYMKEMRGE